MFIDSYSLYVHYTVLASHVKMLNFTTRKLTTTVGNFLRLLANVTNAIEK